MLTNSYAGMNPQDYGRMGDSMLVHMNPREVAGLQSLARSQGTSLTVNPNTGYPEAFNLQRLLPLIAGLALGPAGYGLTATQAGLATGALATAATGSLKEGIKAGLGAYGGAGVGEGLVNAAPPTDPNLVAPTPTPTPTPSPTAPTTTVPGGDVSYLSSYTGPQTDLIDGGLTSPGGSGVSAGLTTNPNPPSAFATNSARAGEGFKQLATGQKGSFDRFLGTAADAKTGVPATGLEVTGGPFKTASMIAASTMQPPKEPEPEDPGMIRPYRYEYENLSGAPISSSGVESPRFIGRFIEEEPYSAARGGLIAYAEGGMTSAPSSGISVTPAEASVYGNIAAVQRAAGLPALDMSDFVISESGRLMPSYQPTSTYSSQMPSTIEKNYGVYQPNPEDSDIYNEIKNRNIMEAMSQAIDNMFNEGGRVKRKSVRKPISRFDPYYDFDLNMTKVAEEQFAKGGISSLGPRFLSGGGDGMSDDIPAVIGDRQPARLADGEFVIPADVVSHIGNGSSKAGAKKLYAMMERVHKERKKAKRGQDSNADRYLPA
jgi:hypothetical protein